MNLLGVLKGTELEKQAIQYLEAEMRGVATYYALAYLAKEKGDTAMAKALENIGNDEARHAGLYNVLNGNVPEDLFTTLAQFAKLESAAVPRIQNFSEAVRGLGLDQAAQAIEEVAKDEGRHGVLLQALIEKHAHA